MKNRILLIRTGGTIDAEPCDDPRAPPPVVTTLRPEDSRLLPTVAALPGHEKVDALPWTAREENRFVSDSQLFTPGDIRALAGIIKSKVYRYFILTHGTDGMVMNATRLQAELRGEDKVVVFAGAMVPLAMPESDGVEALRFSIAHIAEQPPGVYIAGTDAAGAWRFFDPAMVQKDRETSVKRLVFTLAAR